MHSCRLSVSNRKQFSCMTHYTRLILNHYLLTIPCSMMCGKNWLSLAIICMIHIQVVHCAVQIGVITHVYTTCRKFIRQVVDCQRLNEEDAKTNDWQVKDVKVKFNAILYIISYRYKQQGWMQSSTVEIILRLTFYGSHYDNYTKCGVTQNNTMSMTVDHSFARYCHFCDYAYNNCTCNVILEFGTFTLYTHDCMIIGCTSDRLHKCM